MKPEKKKPMTAAELLSRLKKDPEHQARVAERDRKIAEEEAVRLQEETPLIEALKNIKFPVRSVWDLVNTSLPYPAALPVLLDHLPKLYSKKTKEGIVRALTIPAARGMAGKALLVAFKTEPDVNLRWVIGNALATVAEESDIHQVAELLQDRSHGPARSMLVHALAKLKGEDAIPELIELLKDQDVAAQAVIALGDLKAGEAKGAIRPFLKDSDNWVRGEARKAIKKIES